MKQVSLIFLVLAYKDLLCAFLLYEFHVRDSLHLAEIDPYQTPDHSFCRRVRDRVGADKMVEHFNQITEQLKSQNVGSEAFTSVDSTSIFKVLFFPDLNIISELCLS